MKKLALLLVMTLGVIIFFGSNRTYALTYTELPENYVDTNRYLHQAEYIPKSKFSPDFYLTDGTGYGTYEATINGVFYGNDIDYFHFYIPFDTTVCFSDEIEFENGYERTNLLKYYLYDYSIDEEEVYNYYEMRSGIELTEGTYVIRIRKSDNYYYTYDQVNHMTISSAPTDYQFTIEYDDFNRSINSYDIDDLKLDNVAGLVWTNRHDMAGSRVVHYSSTFYNNDLIVGTDNREFLYKRVYVTDKVLADYFDNTLSMTYDLLIGEYDSYISSTGQAEEIDSWLDAGFSIYSNASFALKIAGTAFPTPLTLAVGTASRLADIGMSIYNNYQFAIMMANMEEILVNTSSGYVVDESKVENFLIYTEAIAEVFKDMLANMTIDEFLDISSTMSTLVEEHLEHGFEGDDYFYFDIIGTYLPTYINDYEYISRKLSLRDFDNDIDNTPDYIEYKTGSINNDYFFENHKRNLTFTLSEKYANSEIFGYGDFELTYLDEYASSSDVTEVRLDTSYFSTTQGSPISTYTLLRNVYAYNDTYGFVDVNVYYSSSIFYYPGTYSIYYRGVNPDGSLGVKRYATIIVYPSSNLGKPIISF